MSQPADLVAAVAPWPGVALHPHRFGGTEFRLGTAEIGHVHADGTVDVPLPPRIRAALVAGGRAEPHHWLPDSGWTTLRLGRHGLAAARDVLRLSYLRQATRRDPALASERAALEAALGV